MINKYGTRQYIYFIIIILWVHLNRHKQYFLNCLLQNKNYKVAVNLIGTKNTKKST